MAYKKVETYDEATTKSLAAAYRDVLGLIGEDADREGLLKTPERVAKAMQFEICRIAAHARSVIARLNAPASLPP